jgi:hypothetical protein
MVRAVGAIVAVALLSTPAWAQSEQNASDASAETSEAVGALTESGVKASVGVVAVPVGSAAVGSVAVGSGIMGAGMASAALADGASNFSNAPLSVSDDVVVAPDAPPNVPFDAQTQPRQP